MQWTEKRNDGELDKLEDFVTAAKAFVREQKGEEATKGEGQADEQEQPWYSWIINYTNHEPNSREKILQDEACKLFVDLSSPYPGRLSLFKYFWVLITDDGEEKAVLSVRQGLARAFCFLYTKLRITGFRGQKQRKAWKFLCQQCLLLSRFYLPLAAIGLFHHSHKEAYNEMDVKITYALLCSTSVIELYSRFATLRTWGAEEWPEMVAQYSLIGLVARNQRHSNKIRIVGWLGCRDFLEQHWCMKPCFSSRRITRLVLGYLRDGWKEKDIIDDAASYRRFNDTRGHCALERNKAGQLGWSIKRPFDESVLLWHVATDLCFFLTPFSDHIRTCDFAKVPSTWQSLLLESLRALIMTDKNQQCMQGSISAQCRAVQCRQMSNYMVYLLFVNPEMLLPGTRRYLFTIAYNELKGILGESLFATAYNKLKGILMNDKQDVYRRVRMAMKELKDIFTDNKRNPISRSQWNPRPVKEEGVIERVICSILDKSTKTSEGHKEELKQGGCRQNFISDAWDLAQGLLNLGDENMWEVIQGVWVEMLCFSASRCRGYLHAKALGSGGEFLSYVWLLMFYMGMETFSERLQREREELPSRQANNNGAPPPPEARNGNAKALSSTSSIHGHCASAPSHLHTSVSAFNSEIHIADMV